MGVYVQRIRLVPHSTAVLQPGTLVPSRPPRVDGAPVSVPALHRRCVLERKGHAPSHLASIGASLVLLALTASVGATQTLRTVTASWDRNADSATVGYVLKYGTAPGTYPWSHDAGNQVTAEITLATGSVYYFVVHAYDATGRQSQPSQESSVDLRGLPPAPPTATLTATLQGASTAIVSWNTTGAVSASLDGGSVTLTGSTSVTLTSGTRTFTLVATNAVGASVMTTASVTVAAPPTSRVNVALASNGATATASSSANLNYPPSAAIDGRRSGAGRGRQGTWEDATTTVPDWLQVAFAAPATIDTVNVFSLQVDGSSPVEPTPTLTSYVGVEDFVVQYWNGADWVPVPGGAVEGNRLVWRSVTFAPVTTNAIRIWVTKAYGNGTRLTEVEAWSAGATLPPNQPPTARLIAPVGGQTVLAGQPLTLQAVASDTDGNITRVDFFAGTQLVGSDASSPYTATWTPSAAGLYSLTAVATDDDNATTRSAAVPLTVQSVSNAPPVVTLTAPTATTATVGVPVTMQAAASDTDGGVSRVDFYAAGQLVGTDAASPYAATWTPSGPGVFPLTAIAVDNLNASTSSAPVTVTVTTPTPVGRTNVALASHGATATASSTYSTDFDPSAVIDGSRSGATRGKRGTWEDSHGAVPDWLQVTFASPATITMVNVFSLQERHTTPVEPTPALTSPFAVQDFEVQAWSGTAWEAVSGGQVIGNTLVWKSISFAPVTTSAIRIWVTRVAGGYTRLTEVEAWTP